MPTGRAVDADRRADRRQDVADQRAGVARGGGVPLVALARGEQRDAVPRQRAGADAGGGEVRQPGQPVVLRPVVGDEQRQRLAGPGVGGAPDADVDLRAEPAPGDRRAPGSARARPPRRASAAPRSRGAGARTCRRTRRAPGAGCRGRTRARASPSWSTTSSSYSSRATGGGGELQPPLAVVAGVVGVRERQVGAQPHGGVPLIRVGQAKEHPLMMAGSAAVPFVLTSVPPISENARTRTTGAPGRGRGPSTLRSLPPISAKPPSSTSTPSGTMMSEPPMIETTVMTVSFESMRASRRSRSAPPMTLTTVSARRSASGPCGRRRP